MQSLRSQPAQLGDLKRCERGVARGEAGHKPDAQTNKPIAQLATHALALMRLVPGLKLFDIKCAWFNEQEYCELFVKRG